MNSIPEADWFDLAEGIFQEQGGLLEPRIRRQFPAEQVAQESVAQLTMITALVEQIEAQRYNWVLLALTHGASTEAVAEAMALAPADVATMLRTGGAR